VGSQLTALPHDRVSLLLLRDYVRLNCSGKMSA